MDKKLQRALFDIVNQIHAVNRSWKLAREMFDNDYFLATSLRNLKVRLQIRLLRNYAPEFVYLKEDIETISEETEALYSLKLVSQVDCYRDAAHLPVRVAQEVLSVYELNKYLVNYH